MNTKPEKNLEVDRSRQILLRDRLLRKLAEVSNDDIAEDLLSQLEMYPYAEVDSLVSNTLRMNYRYNPDHPWYAALLQHKKEMVDYAQTMERLVSEYWGKSAKFDFEVLSSEFEGGWIVQERNTFGNAHVAPSDPTSPVHFVYATENEANQAVMDWLRKNRNRPGSDTLPFRSMTKIVNKPKEEDKKMNEFEHAREKVAVLVRIGTGKAEAVKAVVWDLLMENKIDQKEMERVKNALLLENVDVHLVSESKSSDKAFEYQEWRSTGMPKPVVVSWEFQGYSAGWYWVSWDGAMEGPFQNEQLCKLNAERVYPEITGWIPSRD